MRRPPAPCAPGGRRASSSWIWTRGSTSMRREFLSQVDHGEPKKVRGLVCLVRLEDFANGVVLPHEETLSKAKEDRFQLLSATRCNFSSIYSLYQDEGPHHRPAAGKTCPAPARPGTRSPTAWGPTGCGSSTTPWP